MSPRPDLAPPAPDGASDAAPPLAHGAPVDLRASRAPVTLHADPLGLRPLFWTVQRGALHAASRLRDLLAGLPERPDVDPDALRRYLVFGFFPGEDTGLRGVRRLPGGHRLRWDGAATVDRWYTLREQIDPALGDPAAAADAVRRALRDAVPRGPAAVFLSGGLDSSAVAAMADPGDVELFTLDLGAPSADLDAARAVAAHLGAPLRVVPVTPTPDDLLRVTASLDLPIGDPVTLPQRALAAAARAAGHAAALNGEGGDQLFGGWTNKPMLAAALYDDGEPIERAYLRSWHRFHEDPALIIAPVGCEALLTPTLRAPGTSLLARLRLTDLALKGGGTIFPRAWWAAREQRIDLHMPLADPALAELAFRLPPALKLRGADEKHVLKLAMRGRLPDPVIDRRKAGMGVPATAWLQGPLRPLVEDALSDASVRRRGLLRPEAVAALRAGEHAPGETRSRRLGERLWTLLALELWLRDVVDAPPAPGGPR